MDNISHSVIGLGVGEFVQRSLAPEADDARQQCRRRLLLFACWAASNLPDADLLLTPLLPDPLGYLLHHRGHTHTVLFAVLQAALLWAAVWLLWPAARTLLRESASARRGLGAALALGLGLHLLLDYLNSYGLHPFYPFDARWFYGDMLFIIEPAFWVAFGVPMAMTLRHGTPKALFLAVLFGVLCWFAAQGFLAWGALAVLVAAGAGLGALQYRAGPHGRAALALAFSLCLAFIAIQGGASRLGRQRIEAALLQLDPATRVMDVSMTAFPSHPLCWNFVSVESNEDLGRYRLRRGVFSLASAWLAPAKCPAALAGPAARPGAPALSLLAEEQGSLAELRKLRSDDCYFEAWLRFARAPHVDAGEASDLRFGSGLRRNFTTIRLARLSTRRACPRHVPDWDFPRSDLLAPQPAATAR
jgi:inner membrane protein